jgi:hypothetical protein
LLFVTILVDMNCRLYCSNRFSQAPPHWLKYGTLSFALIRVVQKLFQSALKKWISLKIIEMMNNPLFDYIQNPALGKGMVK